MITTGERLPAATLLALGDGGPEPVDLAQRIAGRKVVLFGVPGAFTGTCTTAHVPSFMRTHDAFAARGVGEIICVSVNDPFVMAAWAEKTGGAAAGLAFLADPECSLVRALGLQFSAPPVGLIDRCRRFSMLVDDGVVVQLNLEDAPGECQISAGETLLEQMGT